MIALSIGAIALIVLFNENRPDSATIAEACQTEVGAAIKTESDRVAAACQQTAPPATKSIPAVGDYPGFTYPSDWAVAMTRNGANTDAGSSLAVHVTTSFYDPGVLVVEPVTIKIYKQDVAAVTKMGSFTDWALSQSKLYGATGTTDANETTLNGQKAVLITSTDAGDGPSGGSYETYYVGGKTNYALVEFFQGNGNNTDAFNAKLAIIKNSLDFSAALDK